MKLSMKEKVSYGLGAVGKDMAYMLSASYILYYYQDVLGVSAIAMGIILMVARVFDAFNNPIMGVVVAKTKTRWGKFRPWLLIGTVLNAFVMYLMFSAPPSLDKGGLVAYAAVTYLVWGVTYTMMDIPFWSMIPAFTKSGKEREGLSALGRSCAGVGSALITIVTVVAVATIGSSMSDKNTDNITKKINANDTQITYYLVERDSDGNATTNIKELDTKDISINITGSKKFFEGISDEEKGYNGLIYLKNENADYNFNIGNKKIDKKDSNSKVEFSMDNIDSKSAVLAIYVSSTDYGDITNSNDFKTDITMKSTLEVEFLGFRYFTIIVCSLFVLFILITCICIKEQSTVDVKTASIKQMFKALIQNDQAITIVFTIVLVNTALYITSNLLIYFFKYDMAGANWQGNYTLFNTFSGGVQILAMMAFPLLRKVFTSTKIFYLCIFSGIFGYLILLAMAFGGISNVVYLFAPGFFIMSSVGMLNVVITVFLANTVDYGELKNSRRDESVIFSMQTFVYKLASGIAALIASICLAVFNIQEDSASAFDTSALLEKIKNSGILQSLDGGAVKGLRMIMTVGPIIILVVAVLIFKARYTLSDEKLAQINKELNLRKESK